MDNSMKHIVMQLEILMKEYPEAKFYIQNQIKTMIRDLLNAEASLSDLEIQES